MKTITISMLISLAIMTNVLNMENNNNTNENLTLKQEVQEQQKNS